MRFNSQNNPAFHRAVFLMVQKQFTMIDVNIQLFQGAMGLLLKLLVAR